MPHSIMYQIVLLQISFLIKLFIHFTNVFKTYGMLRAGDISGNKNTFCTLNLQTNKVRQILSKIHEKNTHCVTWHKCSGENKSKKWMDLQFEMGS